MEWLNVARPDEVPPGERLVFEVGRTWIVLFNVGGQFYAVEDECTHEEFSLSEGTLTDHAIECSKHGACFDIRDGKVLAPPAFRPVKTFPVRVEDGEIQVGWG